MSLPPVLKKSFEKFGIEWMVSIVPLLASSGPLRHAFLSAMQKYIQLARVSRNLNDDRPQGVTQDLLEYSNVIRHTADRILTHNLSRPVLRSAASNLVSGIMVDGGQVKGMDHFREEYKIDPPGFLTLSPGKACNLRCSGCYANAGEDAQRLEWSCFERIIHEAISLWGIRFLVISGGEPLAYRSEGKGILDAAEKHPNVFFLIFTNGTLVDEETTTRLAGLGNVTLAISIEGWCQRTDERRGAGVYDKILQAMQRLRKAGVPFGISLTATRQNVEEIFSDEFIDFFFEKQGALYGWLFHYMPIGRSFTLDLMPTPEQRVWMWQRVWKLIRERHLFLADFWNHGTLSDGCLAGGRSNGGYLYIDWNGAVSPCVFVPYSPVNVRRVYAEGGSLNDIWEDPFFAGIRDWQSTYRKEKGNWLAPCIIRDHYRDFRNLISQHEPDPSDENAHKALLDADYASGMEKYDAAYQTLSDPVWQKYYLKSAGPGNGRNHPGSENRD